MNARVVRALVRDRRGERGTLLGRGRLGVRGQRKGGKCQCAEKSRDALHDSL